METRSSASLRIKAAAIHLIVCVVIAMAAFETISRSLYPPPMLQATGADRLFALMLISDVVLGPLLTFVIYNPTKKSLRTDLLCVVILQSLALIFGLHTLWAGRPVYIAASAQEFVVISAPEISTLNLEKSNTSLPIWGPILVGVREPQTKADSDMVELLKGTQTGGPGHLPQLHVAYEKVKIAAAHNSQSTESLFLAQPWLEGPLNRWVEKRGLLPREIGILPARIRNFTFPAVVLRDAGRFIGIAPFPYGDQIH